MAQSIAVLRTAFDKLGGLSTTAHMDTPKRPLRLAELVSGDEVGRMIQVLPTIRDRLLVGFLYGCGLKAGEVCRLRWADVDAAGRGLTVHFAGDTRQRRVDLPNALLPRS
jgi:integrase/recombinase XerD